MKSLKVSKTPVEITAITENTLKEGSIQIELKQTIVNETNYTSNNGIDDNPFAGTNKSYQSQEKRVVWLDGGKFPEGVENKRAYMNELHEKYQEVLNNNAECCIVKQLSLYPILKENQLYGIQNGITTIDKIGEKQLLKAPIKDKFDANGKNLLGLVLFNGPDGKMYPIYKINFFKQTTTSDINSCEEDFAQGKIYNHNAIGRMVAEHVASGLVANVIASTHIPLQKEESVKENVTVKATI